MLLDVTAVVAVSVDETPVLVGDVVLSYEGERVGYTGKIYRVALNLVVGWSGSRALAHDAVARLLAAFPGEQNCTEGEVRRAFDQLADLRGGSRRLEIIGWFVPSAGQAKVLRWSTSYEPTFLSLTDGEIGDGGDVLRKMMAPPLIGGGNTVGYETVPTKAANGFIEARFVEMLSADWPRTWGAAFDLLVFQEGRLLRSGKIVVDRRFRWLPSLTYIAWDLTIDQQGRLIGATQLPTVYKQERVHPCTVIHGKALDAPDHVVKVSTPVHLDDIDEAMYLRRPFSAVSEYYANYFRLFRDGAHLETMMMVVGRATRNGVMYHDSADAAEPRFAVTENLEGLVSTMLQRMASGQPSYERLELTRRD